MKSVGLEEGVGEQGGRDLNADVAEVAGGGEAAFAELVDVEGELGLDVCVGALGVVDAGAVLLFEAGELDGDGDVDGGAVTDGVADVVGERADGEGELVGGLRVVEKGEDEVSRANIVGEVGEKLVAEGVVAEVLNGAATVGVGVRLPELGRGDVGEAAQEKGPDGLLPGEVDEFFVALDRVRQSGERGEDEAKGDDGLEERFAVKGEDVGSPVYLLGLPGRGLRCFFGAGCCLSLYKLNGRDGKG